uniref:RNA-dependent RNA polymerase n=1 Tax=Picornavirales sp. TaxID=1955153 RepID=A0A6M9Z8M7_9VIRU|nr:MAG: hypothetical protein [Picornavirales sp.]
MLTSACVEVPGPYWHGCPQAVRMLNVYHFIYRQFDYEFRPTHQDLIFFEWMASTNRLAKYLKWKTANILVRASLSMDLVPCPFDVSKIPKMFDPFFSEDRLGILSSDNGFYRMKFFRCRRRMDRRFLRFAFSLYQSKSASLPSDAWEISLSVREAIERLSLEKGIDHSLMTPRSLLTEDSILREIDRTVDEVFPSRPESYPPPRHPGRGACLGSPRSSGGSLGYTVRWLLRYDFLPYEYLVGYFEGPSRSHPIYAPLCGEDVEWARRACQIRACTARSVPSIPVGFAEPFKVRVVTLGEYGVYGLARDVQPRIWSQLKAHPTFQLVGESLGPRSLRHFFSQLDPTTNPWIISGDYTQATDHIPSYLSDRIMERICFRMGVPYEMIPALIASLTRHELLFESRISTQRSGQLMGSPSSFPVLCIYNAALSRLAWESSSDRQMRVNLDSIPMLVNGDDLLLGGDLSTYLTWKRVVGWGGLTCSLGKTLVSQRIFTINSRLYEARVQDSFGTQWYDPIPLPHLQLPLALGSMKKGQYDFNGRLLGSLNPADQSRCWMKFMESAANPVRAWNFLYGANREILSRFSREFPTASFCLPPEAGGLGFPLPPQGSPFLKRRSPRSFNLMAARLLLESGTEDHSRLRSAWLRSLDLSPDEPSENILFRDQAHLLDLTGCPFLRVPFDHSEETLVPPNILSSRIASVNRIDRSPTTHRKRLEIPGKIERGSLD